jgi:Cu/Ag efflux pump CusA
MTALAAFFALLPMSLGLERGSEASTPLGRAVIGGLLAGLVTTLFVVPALYSLALPAAVPVAEAAEHHEAAAEARPEEGHGTGVFTKP